MECFWSKGWSGGPEGTSQPRNLTDDADTEIILLMTRLDASIENLSFNALIFKGIVKDLNDFIDIETSIHQRMF